MARQSRGAVVILTRPAAQSLRFADSLRLARPDLAICLSPLSEDVAVAATPPAGHPDAVIFTSETGVAHGSRWLSGLGIDARHAFAVGDRTAEVAHADGFTVLSASGDADALVRLIEKAQPRGVLWHLAGERRRGDIVPRLRAAGIMADAVTLYRQEPRALSPEACAVLGVPGPIVLPVFSPDSALRLRNAMAETTVKSRPVVVAISRNAAEAFGAWPDAVRSVAARPTAEAMRDAVLSALDAAPLA